MPEFRGGCGTENVPVCLCQQPNGGTGTFQEPGKVDSYAPETYASASACLYVYALGVSATWMSCAASIQDLSNSFPTSKADKTESMA